MPDLKDSQVRHKLDRDQMVAIAKRITKKTELPQVWISFIDEITEEQK